MSKIAEVQKITHAKITTFRVNDPLDDGTFLYKGCFMIRLRDQSHLR